MNGRLQVENVTFVADEREILRDVSLSIGDAEIHALLGPNAAGKSTLANLIMGCGGAVPTKGTIVFGGEDISRLPVFKRARLGLTMAWQEPARFEGLTVRDYLCLGMPQRGETEAAQVLRDVLLEPSIYLDRLVDRRLSGGERKRIELAAVLAMKPKLAILDEPDSGIDLLAMENMVSLIGSFRSRGASVLLISHRQEVAAIADKSTLICGGQVVATGSPAEVAAYYANKCVSCSARRFPGVAGNQEVRPI